jgi:hypothetical protein
VAGSQTNRMEPVVYGEVIQLVVLLESITRVIESEPREMFADASVRQRVRELSGMIRRRVDEAMTEVHR